MSGTASCSISSSPARGPMGPPGQTNATTLRGARLDTNVAAPPVSGAILIWDPVGSVWTAVQTIDIGTF